MWCITDLCGALTESKRDLQPHPINGGTPFRYMLLSSKGTTVTKTYSLVRV